MGHFSRSLIEHRLGAGFKTAYAFYHSNGGRRVFPFTYAYYAKIERGETLPRPAWIPLLLRMYRSLSTAQAARIARDYLKDLSGDATTFDSLFAPIVSIPEESQPHLALRMLRGRMTYHVTPAQFRAICSSPQAYGSFAALNNTRKPLNPARIAGLTGVSEASCRSALLDLRKSGLIRSQAGGHFALSAPGKHYSMPVDAGSMQLYGKMRECLDTLARKSAPDIYDGWALARLERGGVESSIDKFKEALGLAAGQSLSAADDAYAAPVYAIEVRMRKIVDYPGSGE